MKKIYDNANDKIKNTKRPTLSGVMSEMICKYKHTTQLIAEVYQTSFMQASPTIAKQGKAQSMARKQQRGS